MPERVPSRPPTLDTLRLLELGYIGRGQFAKIALAESLPGGGLLRRRLRALRTVGTELPSALDRSVAVRTAATDTVTAGGTGHEVRGDAGAAAGTEHARFAYLCDHA